MAKSALARRILLLTAGNPKRLTRIQWTSVAEVTVKVRDVIVPASGFEFIVRGSQLQLPAGDILSVIIAARLAATMVGYATAPISIF